MPGTLITTSYKRDLAQSFLTKNTQIIQIFLSHIDNFCKSPSASQPASSGKTTLNVRIVGKRGKISIKAFLYELYDSG